MCSDISVVSIEILIIEEHTDLSETFSEVTSDLAMKLRISLFQSHLQPILLLLLQKLLQLLKQLPYTLHNENFAESSVVTVLKESNLSQETSYNPKKEIYSSSRNTELFDEKGSVLLSDGGEVTEIGMRLKGDMVVVGDRDIPLSSEPSGTSRDSSHLQDVVWIDCHGLAGV